MSESAERVKLHGGMNSWDYQAGLWLQGLLERGLPENTSADFWVHVDANIPAARKGQIDLILRGFFPVPLSCSISSRASLNVATVFLQSVIAILEVKGHLRENVELTSTQAIVYAWNPISRQREPSSVTEDSQRQMFALQSFLQSRLNLEKKPWLARAIYFPNLTEADLPAEPHFYLASDTSFEALLRRICFSAIKKDYKHGAVLLLNSFKVKPDDLPQRQKDLGAELGSTVSKPRPASPNKDSKEGVSPPAKEYVSPTGAAPPNRSAKVPEPTPATAMPGQARSRKHTPAYARRLLRWFWHRSVPLFASGVLLVVFLAMFFAIGTAWRNSKGRVDTLDAVQFVTCSAQGSAESCKPTSIFHPGNRVLLRMTAVEKEVASAQVIAPGIRAILPKVTYLNDKEGSWIQLKLGKHARTGVYRFEILVLPKRFGWPRIYRQEFSVVR